MGSMKLFQKLVCVLCLIHVLKGCLYIPVTGPKSEGVAEKTTVEALVEENELEVRRLLGEPQWVYVGREHKYLIYQGWQQRGLVLMMPLGFMGPPPFGWLERPGATARVPTGQICGVSGVSVRTAADSQSDSCGYDSLSLESAY